jgi:hypothetical protein
MLAAHILYLQFSGMFLLQDMPNISLPTAVPCVTTKSQIKKIKLLFTWLMSLVIFLLPLSAVLVIQHVGLTLHARQMMKDLT